MNSERHRVLAEAGRLLDAGRGEEAFAAIDGLLARMPGDTMAWLRAGELLDARGRRRRAVRAYLQAADLFAGAGDSLRAAALLRRVGRLDGSRLDARIRLARLYREMGLVPDAANALLEAAGELRQCGQRDAWCRLAEEALALRPGDTALLDELALAYFQQGEIGRALARLKRSLELDPEHPATLGLLGDALLYARRPDMAARCFKELARVHCGTGDERAMRAALERVAEIRRAHPGAVLRYGPHPPGANRADLGPMIREAFLKRPARTPPPAGMDDPPAQGAEELDLELALVDYFLERGLPEEAGELLDRLTRRHGDLPELAARRERCAAICSQPRRFPG